MHLLSDAATIGHNSHIARYHRRDARLSRRIHYPVHRLDVLVIDDGEIGLYAVGITFTGNVAQVVDAELVGTMRAHVQLSDSEIHRVGPRLYRSSKTLTASHRSHYLEIAIIHIHHVFIFFK